MSHPPLIALALRSACGGIGSSAARRLGRSATACLVAILSNAAVFAGDAFPRFNFGNDIVPILTKFGCNSSACQGKAEGQSGSELPVFGFDAAGDHAALTQGGRGRRVLPALVDRSLLLVKGCGQVPHGGGVRIPHGSNDDRTLHDRIAAARRNQTPVVAESRVELVPSRR